MVKIITNNNHIPIARKLESESGQNNKEIAQDYSINWGLVKKWVKDKNRIASAADSENKKYLKIITVCKYKELL